MNPCAKYKSMHGFKWTSSKTRNCKCILRFLKNVRFPPARFLDMHNTYVCCKSFVHTINILIDRRVNVCHNCVHKLFVLLAKRPPPKKKQPKFFGVHPVTNKSYAESNKTVQTHLIHRMSSNNMWLAKSLPFLRSRSDNGLCLGTGGTDKWKRVKKRKQIKLWGIFSFLSSLKMSWKSMQPSLKNHQDK